jgi:hypothetical protein
MFGLRVSRDMTDHQDGVDQSTREAVLRRQELHWQAQIDDARHSDRAAVDIGIATLKTAVLINAGALVAILALVGQLWHDQPKLVAPVLSLSRNFGWGLISAAIGSVAAYFYQSLVTLTRLQLLTKLSAGAEPRHHKLACRCLQAAKVAMLLLVIGAFVLFIVGVTRIVTVLHP